MIPSSSNSRRSHFTAAAATILASALLSSSSSSSVFAAPPQFVQACLNGIYDGVNLIQVNCTTRADSGEYIINNSSGTTIIKNCQFNGCGSIHAKTDVQFINVLFNSSSYGGTNSQFNGGAGGAVAINGVNGYFSNVTFSNCKAK